MLRRGLSIVIALFLCSCGKSDRDVKWERPAEPQDRMICEAEARELASSYINLQLKDKQFVDFGGTRQTGLYTFLILPFPGSNAIWKPDYPD